MSLKLLPLPAVPEETARVVRACFPHGTLVVAPSADWHSLRERS